MLGKMECKQEKRPRVPNAMRTLPLYIFLSIASICHARHIPTYTQIKGIPTSSSTATETTTITSTTTITEFYRAGLVLFNKLTISGVDAYLKDFTVNNIADVVFANSGLNVFAVPTTATCAYISTVVLN